MASDTIMCLFDFSAGNEISLPAAQMLTLAHLPIPTLTEKTGPEMCRALRTALVSLVVRNTEYGAHTWRAIDLRSTHVARCPT